MSLIIDAQYAGMLKGHLRNFRRLGTYKFQFACPFCGDSQRNKKKARGYLWAEKGKLAFKCHNCDYPANFYMLLNFVDTNLAKQYQIDSFIEKGEKLNTKKEERILEIKRPEFTKQIDPKLIKLSTLPSGHKARTYVDGRKIPTNKHFMLYYTPEFRKWVNTIHPETFKEGHDEARLIIPLIDGNNNVLGYQGRALGASLTKYITVMLDPSYPKIFGLNTTDVNRRVRVFEGPIDSLFIDNAVASAGGRVDSTLPSVGISYDRSVIVYDNEPRNIHTIQKMQKAVEAGYPVCVWPETLKETDVNAMILAGMKATDITNIIDDNTYRGLMAEVKISEWRKV